jgi:hypothetical protein
MYFEDGRDLEAGRAPKRSMSAVTERSCRSRLWSVVGTLADWFYKGNCELARTDYDQHKAQMQVKDMVPIVAGTW